MSSEEMAVIEAALKEVGYDPTALSLQKCEGMQEAAAANAGISLQNLRRYLREMQNKTS